jgi:hypothetical protein
MLKVEVSSANFSLKEGVSAKTGKPYKIREQEGWMYCYGRDGKPQPHPQLIRVTLDDDQEPYQPGNYILCPSSIYIDRFGQPAIRARLRAQMAAPLAKAA